MTAFYRQNKHQPLAPLGLGQAVISSDAHCYPKDQILKFTLQTCSAFLPGHALGDITDIAGAVVSAPDGYEAIPKERRETFLFQIKQQKLICNILRADRGTSEIMVSALHYDDIGMLADERNIAKRRVQAPIKQCKPLF